MKTNAKHPAIVALLTLVATAAVSTVGAQQTCLAPAMHVDIFEVSKFEDGAGVRSATLHVNDQNPPERVSGYNVYRSPSAATPPGSWGLPAFDTPDQDAATPGVQWSDVSGVVSASGVHFYLVAPYNVACDTEGPWMRPSTSDEDGDGMPDADDPCPGTPRGALLVMAGCSATDYLLNPGLLLDPVEAGLDDFVAGLPAASAPQEIFESIDQAQVTLDSAADDLRDALPCAAETGLAVVAGHLDDVVAALQDHLLTLAGAGSASAAWPAPAGPIGGTGDVDGDYVYPSPEYRMWAGQLFKFMTVHDGAAQSSAVAAQVCAAAGAPFDVSGRVHRITDSTRTIELDSGERIVMGWNAVVQGGDEPAEDQPVALQGTRFDGIGLASMAVTQVSPFPFIDTSMYDDCLQLRVLPVQPLPGAPYPQTGWIRHSPEGYRGSDTILALEARMKLITEDTGCPGIVPGLGPTGEDVRIDYYYQLLLSYQPRQGGWINLAPLAYKASGDSFPIEFPKMHPLVNATLFSTKVKRTCIDAGFSLPVIDPESGNVSGLRRVWNCSAEQVVAPPALDTIIVRDPQTYCGAIYSDLTFDLEDHDLTDWRPVSVTGLTLPVSGVQGVTFAAIGGKIVNGVPTAGTVGQNEAFAVYSPFRHNRNGFGTDRASHLDWPHITGSRNGEAYRYTCGVPKLLTDRIYTCPGPPDTFYRMPFPLNADNEISQGNGGSTSHNTWQLYALDIRGNGSTVLRAARGGKVVMIRKNMTLNCIAQTCTQFGLPPNGMLDEFGNYVALQHQDGTVSWYMHMVIGSSPLKLGDTVMRGAYLGQLGNSGNSTGPHVHIQVTPGNPAVWTSTTNYVVYEAYNVTDSWFQTCMVPQQGKTYRSTNQP